MPGNDAIESAFQDGFPRRPTPEELQRAIEWTAQHPEWQQEAEQELEDIGGARYQEGDTGTPEQTVEAPSQAPQGPRLYIDSKTQQIVQADHSPDPQRWWRLISGVPMDWSAAFGRSVEWQADADVEASLAEGEPAVIVPLDFTGLPPAEQIRVAGQAINQQYGDATQQAEEGRFLPQLRELQRQWGVSPVPVETLTWPDEEGPTAAPPEPIPESRLLQPDILLAGVSPEEGDAIRDMEDAESRWRFRYDPTVSPFNQGEWPSEERTGTTPRTDPRADAADEARATGPVPATSAAAGVESRRDQPDGWRIRSTSR